MPGKWDGRSRIPTKQYKDNYDQIFGKKKKTKRKTKSLRKKS